MSLNQLRGEVERFQDLVEAQALPEFQTDVDVPGRSGPLDGDPIDVNRNHLARRGRGGDWQSGRREGLHELSQFRILIGESREDELPGECILEFSGQGEPLLGRSGREVAK